MVVGGEFLGMSALTKFRKSGSGDTPTRTPDNLRSKDTVEVVVGLGMGPIKGPAYGLKGIYVGDTPIQNQNDSYNFKNFEYWFRPGAANDEAVKFRLGGQTNSTTVNVNLYSGTPVVRQTPHGNIDAIKFRIVINSLLWQQDDGDVYQNTAKFKLEYKAASSATWLPCFPPTAELSIKGKTTSTYVKEYRILVPRIDEPYDLRVTKTSPESDEEKIVEITWESFQTVITGDKKFNGEAVAHYLGEASDQFSSLPQFWGVYDLMLCRMPDNYDPYTKTWDGTWDGITWKNDWTDNPALVFNEILANEEWGAAAYYPDVTLNKWDLVAAIEWCDGLVPNGQGGYQPRYTFNGLLTEARSGPEMLRFVAGIFGGIPYDGLDGEIRLKLDVDSDAVALFTPENVIEENSITFDYSYTDLTTRYNAISGTFMNPNLDWSEDRLYLENEDAIAANGRIPLDLIAEACTNRHECTRRTMLRLITSQTEKTIVTFKTNRLGLTTELFDIFLVADPDMDWGITGRVKSLSVDREIMYLRDQIYLEAGVDYEIVFQVPGGPTTALAIPNTNVGALTQIDFGAALPAGVEELTTFAIQAPNEPSTPKPFRLVDIAEVEDRTDVVQITGLEVNRNKWAAADAAEYQAAPLYSRPLSAAAMQPPTDLTVDQEAQYAPNGLFIRARLNWQPTTTPGVKHYQVWMSRADDAPILQGTTEDSTFIIPDLPPGPYTFQVYPVSILNNLRSAVPAEVDLYLGDTSGVGTSILTNLEILNQGVDTVFSGRDVVMSWVVDPPAGYFPLGNPTFDGSGFVDPTIAEFKVEILDADTDAVLFTDWTVNTYYRWTYLNNLTILSGPRREFKVQITGLTTYGIYTDPIVLEISNPPPAAPTGVSAAFDADAVRVFWDLPDDPDYAGTVVYMSTTSGFTPGPSNVVYRGIGPDARIAVTTTGDKYYRVGHYDAFSDTPTNLTAQQTFNVARLYVADLDAAISDNVLSKSEKLLIVPALQQLIGAQTDLDSRATALGITTKKTTYDNAISTLTATLATYTTPVLWSNLAGDTTIVGATLASQYQAALNAEIALQTEIDTLNANALIVIGGQNLFTKANWRGATFAAATFVESGAPNGVSGWGLDLARVTGTSAVTSATRAWTQGIDYTVSFIAQRTAGSGTANLQVDLFPDTLPQQQFVVGATAQKFSWTFNSSHADMTSASMRFFLDQVADNNKTVRITDIMVERGNKASDWVPAPGDSDNALVPISQNSLFNSAFAPDLSGWLIGASDVDTGFVPVSVRNPSGKSGINNVLGTQITGTPASGKAFISSPSMDTGTLTDKRNRCVKVTPGQRIFASAMHAQGAAGQISIAYTTVIYFDSSGTYSSEVSFSVGSLPTGANGDPANYVRAAGFHTVPAGAAFACIRAFYVTAGGANPLGLFMQPYLGIVRADVTAFPDYQPGPVSFGNVVANLVGNENLDNAGVSTEYANPNATFAGYSTTTGLPTGVNEWINGAANCSRIVGKSSAYGLRINGVAGADVGFSWTLTDKIAPGLQVFECEVQLVSGTFTGAAMHMNWTNSAVTFALVNMIDPATGAAVGTGTVGKLYKLKGYFDVAAYTPANAVYFYLMAHWTGVASNAVANSIDVHRWGVRSATPQEIAANRGLTLAGTLSSISGRLGVDIKDSSGTVQLDGDLKNIAVPLGQNRVYNSRMDPDTSGYGAGWDGTVGGTVTRGRNAVGKFGARNVMWVATTGTPANDTTVECHATVGPTGGLADLRRYACKAEAGDRIYFSGLLGFTNFKNAYMVITFGDATGAYITELGTGAAALTAPGNGDSGTAMQRQGGFVTAPAGTHYAWLRARFTANGSGATPVGYWSEPFLAVVGTSQTAVPAFTHGEIARGAIVDALSPTEQVGNSRITTADINRVAFSQFEANSLGWGPIEAASGGISITSTTVVTTSGRKGLQVNFTASGAGILRFGLIAPYLAEVGASERMHVSMVTGAVTGVASIGAVGTRTYSDVAGTAILTTTALSTVTGGFTGQKWALNWNVDATAVRESIHVLVNASGAGSGSFIIYEPLITGVPQDTVGIPTFVPAANAAGDALQQVVTRINKASEVGTPNSSIFSGSDPDTWISLCDIDIVSTGGYDIDVDCLADLLVEQIFDPSVNLDSKVAGAPKFRLKVERSGAGTIYTSPWYNLSSIGQLPASIFPVRDTNVPAGNITYTLYAQWTKGAYTAGTVSKSIGSFVITGTGVSWLANIGQSGTGAVPAARAFGVISFAGQPANGNTITFNGQVITFVNSGATANQSNIGANLNATINNLVGVLNGHASSNINVARYANSGGTQVTIGYKTAGAAGNAYTLARVGANITVPATLSNGSNAGVVPWEIRVPSVDVNWWSVQYVNSRTSLTFQDDGYNLSIPSNGLYENSLSGAAYEVRASYHAVIMRLTSYTMRTTEYKNTAVI